MLATSFQFYSPGRLLDEELELITPHSLYIPEVLRECHHPLTRQVDPRMADTTRQNLEEFLRFAPGGRIAGDARRNAVPAYYFWMRWHDEESGRSRMAGGIGVRIGATVDLEYYAGHIGYHVYPPARGRHFAERACRLVAPLFRFHQINPVWITCNPDNEPSKRTCQRLGATYVDTVDIPDGHPFFARGETQKNRYRWEIPESAM